MVIEVLYAETARVVSRLGEETRAAGTGRELPGVGAEPDPVGGEDFESRPQANKSNATSGSDTRSMNIGTDRVWKGVVVRASKRAQNPSPSCSTLAAGRLSSVYTRCMSLRRPAKKNSRGLQLSSAWNVRWHCE